MKTDGDPTRYDLVTRLFYTRFIKMREDKPFTFSFPNHLLQHFVSFGWEFHIKRLLETSIYGHDIYEDMK
jgi:hypothetical protein